MFMNFSCIYYKDCTRLKDTPCPCHLDGATEVVPQIKKDMQSGKEGWETDDKLNVSSYSMYFEMLACLNAGGNNDDLANILMKGVI